MRVGLGASTRVSLADVYGGAFSNAGASREGTHPEGVALVILWVHR